MNNLHDQVAIVTGASRGLGEATAARLLAAGAHIVLAGRDDDTLSSVVSYMRANRVAEAQQIVGQVCNVARPAEVDRLVEVAGGVTGRIDILVCNAGIYGPMGRVEDVDWSEWVEALEINLFGTVLCCRAVLPWMRQQARGKIVLLSGGGATQPLPRMSAYAASKAAVVRFGETLAEELRDTGIEVNSVAPGALNTRLLDQVLAAGPDQVGKDFYDRAVQQCQRGGTPLDLPAELIAFLASPASDGITGRLISAVWDDWRGLPAQRERLSGGDVYTLRRIVPEDRQWANE